MHINKNKIETIVSETLHRFLNEAPTMQNQNTMQNGNTMQNQNTMLGNNQNNTQQNQSVQDIDDVRKNRPGNTKQQLGQTLKKGVFGAAGIGVGMGALGAAMGVAAGGMAGMTGILMVLGLGSLVANLAGNLMALKRAKELKFPRTIHNAMEYAKFAAAERAEAQDMCRKIQQNLQNAIAAYNQKFNKDLDTSDGSVFGNETAEFQDRGQTQNVNVDWDRDFTNVNAGQNESRLYEDYNSAEDANRAVQILDTQHFVNKFAQMQEDQALQAIEELKKQYKEAYGLWMQWTRYINVLVHIWNKEGLTWEVVINSNKNADTKSMIKNFLQQKLGIGEDGSDYQPSNQSQQNNILNLRVSVLDYPVVETVQQQMRNGSTRNVKQQVHYILFKDPKKKIYYAAPKNNNLIQFSLNKEMPITLNFNKNMLTGKKIPTQDGKTIYVLNNNGIKALKPVTNNGQTQTI